MAVDDQVKRAMEELGRALTRTIRTSSDASEAVRKIHHQGFTLHLALSCEPDEEPDSRSLPARRPTDDGSATRIELAGQPATSRSGRQLEPAFRLNGHDVGLLKSLGIDGTRRGRRSPSRRRRGS